GLDCADSGLHLPRQLGARLVLSDLETAIIYKNTAALALRRRRIMVRSTFSSRAGQLAGLVLGASLVGAIPALANCGDFFEELLASWSAANADSGQAYFGFIKDNKGKLLPNASVSATTPSGSTFVVQGDAMGHYKIPGFSKSVDASKVQISCSKTGYKL